MSKKSRAQERAERFTDEEVYAELWRLSATVNGVDGFVSVPKFMLLRVLVKAGR